MSDVETGTDLERRPRLSIAHRQREDFDPGQLELIRNTVAKDCTPAELAMFLEVCARYELDPFSKQVWAAKIQGSLQIIVSRDGLLALANRSEDFRGCQSDVVRERDLFRKTTATREDGSVEVVVEHEYRDAEGKSTHGGANGELRGPIVGAWARVRRLGHDDTYFFAYWAEYKRGGNNPWSTHPSAMMQKVPETYALRKAFSVSGVVGETEVDSVERTNLTAPPAGPDFGPDLQIAARLAQLFDLLEYPERKQILKLAGPFGAGLDDGGRLELVAELVEEAKARGLDVPPLESDVDTEAEEIAEAEVVEPAEAEEAA